MTDSEQNEDAPWDPTREPIRKILSGEWDEKDEEVAKGNLRDQGPVNELKQTEKDLRDRNRMLKESHIPTQDSRTSLEEVSKQIMEAKTNGTETAEGDKRALLDDPREFFAHEIAKNNKLSPPEDSDYWKSVPLIKTTSSEVATQPESSVEDQPASKI